MIRFIKVAAAWLVAALVASIASSILSSQQVLSALAEVGASVSLQQRLSMTLADLGILQTLLPVMAGCFAVGFIVATFCHKWFGGRRDLWYIAAGASSIVCTLMMMSTMMQLMPVAGARDAGGMVLISLAGALGGLVFSRLSLQPPEQAK